MQAGTIRTGPQNPGVDLGHTLIMSYAVPSPLRNWPTQSAYSTCDRSALQAGDMSYVTAV